MAGLYCCIRAPHLMRLHGLRCSSSTPHNNFNKNMNKRETQTPQILKLAVSGVTELLRLFSSSRSERVDDKKREEISVSGVNDVVMILKSDYENAYFVTGAFTSAIYAEDCIFEDPTIRFRGKALYSRNLKLLVPFFDRPSIGLQKIDKGINSKTNFVLATWKLRTYLKLPWKPLICIDGSTVYELDDKFNIVRHAESWNVSALEAIGQIFTPSFGRPND
ncbi:uncharacterized protein LOC133883117 isoform X2 [Alnus glutinosa]|uniref:uncharacterized protein LOC133883117 isoform X2 n=1 Tax=Alnus glutinosa TaxID=3517 RepID=UPI002D7811AF|nr:uncharacterized protein LOC133883117 isoform X2 [Alnus glutinosa]